LFLKRPILSRPKNLCLLIDLPGGRIAQVRQRKPVEAVVLDLDSSVSPTHGQQEGSAFNGSFSKRIAFGPHEPQNARPGSACKHSKTDMGNPSFLCAADLSFVVVPRRPAHASIEAGAQSEIAAGLGNS
jgi:hypothetical protein